MFYYLGKCARRAMEYRIQTLAKTCGVSVRTLRHYDEIGILRPKVRMANGRCYYGMRELFKLSLILSLKEFGFGLKKIQSILEKNGTHMASVLRAQKTIILKEQERLKKSLQMIDVMIQHYKGDKTMDATPENIENMVEAFKAKKEHAKYFEEAFMEERRNEYENKIRCRVGEEYWEALLEKGRGQNIVTGYEYGKRYGELYKDITEAMKSGFKEDSKEVQTLMEKQWEILQMIYPPTHSKEVYFAIRDQLTEPFDMEHKVEVLPFLNFVNSAMTIFGEKHFS